MDSLDQANLKLACLKIASLHFKENSSAELIKIANEFYNWLINYK